MFIETRSRPFFSSVGAACEIYYTEFWAIFNETQPQGKLKNYRKRVVRNVVEDGYTEVHAIV